MILLGVETSGPIGSIALRREHRCIEEYFLPELSRRHAQSLVPAARGFLHRHGLSLHEVEAVAVSIGPGSFTGLRVGVTFAKTLAYAANARLVAVDTFLSIAENTPSETAVTVVADAQQRGLMVGQYKRQIGTRFARRGDISLVPRTDAQGFLKSATLVSGSGFERLPEQVLSPKQTAPEPFRYSRAAVIARLGEELIAQGIASDIATLEPVYIRKSAAEEKREMNPENG